MPRQLHLRNIRSLYMPGATFFLDKKVNFYIVLAVVATTLSPWYNVNSWFIILLVICRLLDSNPGALVRSAFSNRYFLAYFSIFILDVIGLAYTHDFFRGWKYVESKATLVAIALVLCASSKPFTDKAGRSRLLSAYCILLALICLYCLGAAAIHYLGSHQPAVFFYHSLSFSAVGVNAVFFSAYVISALLFLLSMSDQHPTFPPWLRTGLIFFFSGMIVLLASKLLLILTLLIFVVSFKRMAILSLSGALLVAIVLFFTHNPISDRYKDMAHGDLTLYKQDKLPEYTVFNGVSLRLLIWRSAAEILNEHKAWLWGVSAGDSQTLLNQKFEDNISGGFLNYNFHNEYIELGVHAGLIGLAVFLAACGSLIVLARSTGTQEAWFTIILFLMMCCTESMLESQHPAFYSCFFPLLLQFGGRSKTAHNDQ